MLINFQVTRYIKRALEFGLNPIFGSDWLNINFIILLVKLQWGVKFSIGEGVNNQLAKSLQ